MLFLAYHHCPILCQALNKPHKKAVLSSIIVHIVYYAIMFIQLQLSGTHIVHVMTTCWSSTVPALFSTFLSHLKSEEKTLCTMCASVHTSTYLYATYYNPHENWCVSKTQKSFLILCETQILSAHLWEKDKHLD